MYHSKILQEIETFKKYLIFLEKFLKQMPSHLL